jgi:hypothetical protein
MTQDVSLEKHERYIQELIKRVKALEAVVYGDDAAKHKQPQIPYAKIVDLYHEVLPSLPQIQILNSKRRSHISARWRTALPNLDRWREYFEHISESPFLMGKTAPKNGHDKVFVADFDWIINETNFTKIAEGKYHGR